MIMAAFLIATVLLLLFGVVATWRKPPLSQRQSSKITPFPGSSANGSGAELLLALGGDAHCHAADHAAHPSGVDASGHGSFDSGHTGFDAGHGGFDVGGSHH